MASAANDNVPARVLDLKAARLDRDPEPKIGRIATSPWRRSAGAKRPSAAISGGRGARNLDRFSAWIAFQRTRLEDLWGRFQRAARRDGRDGEELQAERSGSSSEQRERLLGRGRDM